MTVEDDKKSQNRLLRKGIATLSVAMCTYNGEPYLGDQLASIAKQSRLPDELVICDDGSFDGTLRILRDFQTASPFPVKIFHNEQNLGPAKNFEKAISLCGGEIIALSDQDDVWLPNKLDVLAGVLEKFPSAGYVFSDAQVVDEKLNSLGYTIWDAISFTPAERRRFAQGQQIEILLRHNVVSGAAMAFRASLRGLVLPIPEHWVHDGWMALLASATGSRGVFTQEPLLTYRQHPKQLIGGRFIGLHEEYVRSRGVRAEWYENEHKKLTQAFQRLSAVGLPDDVSRLFAAKLHHLHTRQILWSSSTQARWFRVWTELVSGRYHRFSSGWKSFAKDLLMVRPSVPEC